MEKELLITPITKSYARVLGFRIKDLVRNYPFEFGVKIKNIGNSTFNEGDITNILLKSASKAVDSIKSYPLTYSIKKLKPKESVSIWFDKTRINIDGTYLLQIDITSKDREDTIYTYQWDTLNKKPVLKTEIKWQDYLYVESEAIEHHRTTNVMLGMISVILLLEILFGVRTLLENLLNFFIDFIIF